MMTTVIGLYICTEVGSLLAGLEFDLKAEHVEITEMDGCVCV